MLTLGLRNFSIKCLQFYGLFSMCSLLTRALIIIIFLLNGWYIVFVKFIKFIQNFEMFQMILLLAFQNPK